MEEKVDFRSVYDIFKCTQVSNFYLLKKASNELLPKTKVVDLEILNNFGIQEFFIWGQEKGEMNCDSPDM